MSFTVCTFLQIDNYNYVKSRDMGFQLNSD